MGKGKVMGKVTRAVLVGAGAGMMYLVGAKVAETRPVSGRTLTLLALAGLATAQASAKSRATEARLAAYLAGTQTVDGSHVGGPLTVHGDHSVIGRTQATGGITAGANLDMVMNNINDIAEVNTNGTDWATHGGLSFIGGRPIWMHGQTIWLQGGKIDDGNGHVWP